MPSHLVKSEVSVWVGLSNNSISEVTGGGAGWGGGGNRLVPGAIFIYLGSAEFIFHPASCLLQ